MSRALLLLLLGISCVFSQVADLILENGKVVTVEAAMPTAQAIAIREGRILAVGSTVDLVSFFAQKVPENGPEAFFIVGNKDLGCHLSKLIP